MKRFLTSLFLATLLAVFCYPQPFAVAQSGCSFVQQRDIYRVGLKTGVVWRSLDTLIVDSLDTGSNAIWAYGGSQLVGCVIAITSGNAYSAVRFISSVSDTSAGAGDQFKLTVFPSLGTPPDSGSTYSIFLGSRAERYRDSVFTGRFTQGLIGEYYTAWNVVKDSTWYSDAIRYREQFYDTDYEFSIGYKADTASLGGLSPVADVRIYYEFSHNYDSRTKTGDWYQYPGQGDVVTNLRDYSFHVKPNLTWPVGVPWMRIAVKGQSTNNTALGVIFQRLWICFGGK